MARRTKAQIEADKKAEEEAKAAEEAQAEEETKSEEAETESSTEQEESKDDESNDQQEAKEDEDSSEKTAEEKDPTVVDRKDAPLGSNSKKRNRVLATVSQEDVDRAQSLAVESKPGEIQVGLVDDAPKSEVEPDRPYKDLSDKDLEKKLAVIKSKLVSSYSAVVGVRSQPNMEPAPPRILRNLTPVEQYNLLTQEKSYRS